MTGLFATIHLIILLTSSIEGYIVSPQLEALSIRSAYLSTTPSFCSTTPRRTKQRRGDLFPHRRVMPLMFSEASAELGGDDAADDSFKEIEEAVDSTKLEEHEKATLLSKLKSVAGFNKKDPDGLTTRQRLAKMGFSTLLSYGFVSNMTYAVSLSLSWYLFCKRTGLSPLAPGQWKPYLAVYAGFYVFNNIVRPVRFGLSVFVAKYFDNFVGFIQNKTNLSRKWSIAVVVFIANICGTLSAMGSGVYIASYAAGVPVFPPKP